MPYQVFALKWRPQNFDAIVGQNHIVTTLKHALQKGRLAHAYIFAGPRGVGKTSTARILAKALNCKEGPTITPCQKCSACLEISQGRSLDVIEVDGASNRGIDEIRTLRENVKFSPVGGKFKVYIIDEVHMLTQEAFNALLKTLEEPPEFVKFIFATTQPNKVLPTILSRCQRLDFRRVSVMEIIAQLEKIVAGEKINVDKEVLFAVARSSDGSLRDAESILDQLVSFSKDRVSLEDVISVLGLIEQEILFEITEKIIQKDALSSLELLNNIIDEGKDTAIFLSNLIEHFRNLMVAKISKADAKLIDLPQEVCEKLLKQSQEFTLEEIFSAFNILVNTQEISKRLDSVRIPLEISLVKLTYDKKGSQLNTQLEKHIHVKSEPPVENKPALKHTHNIPEKTHTPKPQAEEIKKEVNPQEHNATPTHSISLESIKGAWQNIITNLGAIKISAATYLNEGIPIGIERNILTVAFPKDYSLHKESLERKENKTIIEKTISELLNANLRVNFTLSKEELNKEENEDGFLKSALQMFKGRVIKS
jgi:DNA polymerase-3 subunit gamma/tau